MGVVCSLGQALARPPAVELSKSPQTLRRKVRDRLRRQGRHVTFPKRRRSRVGSEHGSDGLPAAEVPQ